MWRINQSAGELCLSCAAPIVIETSVMNKPCDPVSIRVQDLFIMEYYMACVKRKIIKPKYPFACSQQEEERNTIRPGTLRVHMRSDFALRSHVGSIIEL